MGKGICFAEFNNRFQNPQIGSQLVLPKIRPKIFAFQLDIQILNSDHIVESQIQAETLKSEGLW